jgi:hypothetical protein
MLFQLKAPWIYPGTYPEAVGLRIHNCPWIGELVVEQLMVGFCISHWLRYDQDFSVIELQTSRRWSLNAEKESMQPTLMMTHPRTELDAL